MKIVLLGGGGLMARATARDLLEDRPDVRLVLADLNVDAAESVAAWLEPVARDRLSTVRADASDVASVRDVIAGADALINAAQYYFNVPVMRAALAERVPYVDLGGLFHVSREQLELHGEFARAGLTAVIGMGSTPGITNVQARRAAQDLERVDRIDVFCANTPEADAPEDFGYSIHTILDELSRAPVVFRDGELRELEPLAEPTTWDFVEPIGPKEVHHSLHSELATLPSSYAERGLRDCSFKLNYFGYTPRALRELNDMADGMPRAELVVELMRRREASRATRRACGEDPDAFVVDHEEGAVEVSGSRNGRPATVRIDTLAVGRDDWRISGGTLLTATPPGIVAGWLADGSLDAPGVHPPEAVVEPARLFDALESRGIRTTIRVSE